MILKIDSSAKVLLTRSANEGSDGYPRARASGCYETRAAQEGTAVGSGCSAVPRGRPNHVVDQRTERFSTSAEPILAGAVVGSALFRMSPRDVPALRRKPGPVPEGYGRVPPSLLRNSDEQTIAG